MIEWVRENKEETEETEITEEIVSIPGTITIYAPSAAAINLYVPERVQDKEDPSRDVETLAKLKDVLEFAKEADKAECKMWQDTFELEREARAQAQAQTQEIDVADALHLEHAAPLYIAHCTYCNETMLRFRAKNDLDARETLLAMDWDIWESTMVRCDRVRSETETVLHTKCPICKMEESERNRRHSLGGR